MDNGLDTNNKENKKIKDSSSGSSEIFESYKNNIGDISTPIILQKLNYIINDYDKDMILKAIEISVMNNKRNLAYIEGILKQWNSNGYKTVSEIKDNKVIEYKRTERKSNLPSDEERRAQNERVKQRLIARGIKVD